ncbi:hypothetical protein FACS1894130_07890 [Spirochaetia bacterium]|nr:hypothetical protein FACS1894130_07890 [Spirochaetia bacterium]
MHKKSLLFGLMLLLTGFALFGQQRPENLADMDAISVGLAIRIDQRIKTLTGENPERTLKIGLGNFVLDGAPLPLGELWKLNIAAGLSNIARSYTLLANEAGADYTISGEILEILTTVRVTVRLIRTQGAAVIASWHVDLDKTPLVAALIEREDGSGGVRRDQYESDSQQNPTVFGIGGDWVSRTIHSEDDRDWFLLSGNQTGVITAETSGSMDTLMELYDESETRIQSNDDGGDGENAKISFFAEAGKRYTAMVRGYSSNTGSYRFHAFIEPIPDEAFEPNDTLETAHPIPLGEPVRALFSSSADEDWYQVEIPADSAGVTIYTEGSSRYTRLAIYDAKGEKIEEDGDSEGNVRLTLALPPGTFYIKAALSGGEGGLYTLQTRVRTLASLDAFEPDDQWSEAKDFEIGVSQRHSFSDENDIDWVRIQITEPGRYGFRARGVSDNQLDTYLELVDEDGELVDADDDGGEEYDAYLSIRLISGTYYLKVTTLDQEPEDEYILSVEKESRR